MLEVRDLTKVYRPKKGTPVVALDRVTISFPDTGMVFLLGKSGSGKSTLLNLIGGLDRYDGGDILISGNSTAAFKQGDFDSYRNTFVGFIFQEYNVLEEFTVGANIALALELQGKKATDEAIGAILDQVDLTGYGARRPNELSGGQKQRVAIARALVKNPKIIMADEPTGALDSATGRTVLDTLKKLSREKLVIVVSHDRDFALRYADRIIELADGKVISDREYFSEAYEAAPAATGPRYEGNTVTVPRGYHLTEADREQINAYLDALATGDLTVTAEGGESVARESRETPAAPPRPRQLLSLIRSRLPLKAAFRIGGGALKFKKFRLVMTVLLSCVAFTLFGLADTFGSYDHVGTCTRSILDTGVTYASLVRADKNVAWDNTYWEVNPPSVSETDLREIAEATGVSVRGVFVPGGVTWDLSDQFDGSEEFTQTDFNVYAWGVSGFAVMEEGELADHGLTLVAGKLPQKADEIAVTSYLCETFYIGGYRAPDAAENDPFTPVNNPADLLGKTLRLAGRDYVVSGVVDTGLDLERYRPLTVASEEEESRANWLIDYALSSELNNLQAYSFAQTGFITSEAMRALRADFPVLRSPDNASFSLEFFVAENGETYNYSLWASRIGRLADRGAYEIHWFDGERTVLGDKEIVISRDLAREFLAYNSDDETAVYDPDSVAIDWDALKTALNDAHFQSYLYRYGRDDGETREEGWTVAGVLVPAKGGDDTLYSCFLVPERTYKDLIGRDDGVYDFAVGSMPRDGAGVRRLVTFCEREEGDHRYELQNSVTFELDTVHEVLSVLGKVFFWIGFGFAVFASVMLSNFIATSINYKKQEIGILRAIGARSNDVFRIFFSESFIIASVNFLFSALGTGLVTLVVNNSLRERVGILVTILPFGPRQVLLILAISLLVAALASFFPVKRIAKKRPIDAIRNR